MARPLRIEFPGAHYHVINRGNQRERIFADDNGFILFLEKMSEFSEAYDIVIHSYCLMPNHFHLQLKTRHANLGKFMQSFLTSFTLSMNRIRGGAGHLFQGRYKAHLVESALYRNKLSRYIHLNPVKTGALEGQPLDVVRKHLHGYRWSSFRAYIGMDRKPKWLDRSHVLGSWGKSAAGRMANYRKYVEEGIGRDNSLDMSSSSGIANVVGSDSFIDHVVKKYLVRDQSDIDAREQSALAEVNAFSLEDVLRAVSEYFKIDRTEAMTVRRGCNPEARKSAMFLAGKHCRRKVPLSAMAARFGLNINGFNMARNRFATELKSDRHLRNMIMGIDKLLDGEKL